MMIYRCKPKVFKGKRAELTNRLWDRNLSRLHPFEQMCQPILIHECPVGSKGILLVERNPSVSPFAARDIKSLTICRGL